MLTFYLGYDNPQSVELQSEGVAQNLSAVTKVELTYDGTTYNSGDNPELFDWTTDPTKLVLKLGLAPGVTAGKDKKAELVTYDGSNPNGIVWGRLAIKIDEVT